MNKIEVAVLDSHNDPGGMMMFLAKLTQRGHSIKDMHDLQELFNKSKSPKSETVSSVAALPHGTIKRFCPITVAVVGASRRFLAQARTHQVGFNYVSASLQYSNYSGKGRFVVPYTIMEHDARACTNELRDFYLVSCEQAMNSYGCIAEITDNDTAGYAAPQGLRNILIMQANHEAWMNFIRLRSCNRNTNETQYVTLRIWEELLKTEDGPEFFKYAGPDCMFGTCREGKMCCGDSLKKHNKADSIPSAILDTRWPILRGGDDW